ncbi:MAG: HEAT repeat domain-containing protein [Candidatus Aminicenantes bacterium]|nr:HEAT repeat domain-containing protein [Candidatus Aminicenantes bacterium]
MIENSGFLAQKILLVSLELLAIFLLFLIFFIIIYRYFNTRRAVWFEQNYQRITDELLEMLTSSDPQQIVVVAEKNKKLFGPLTHALLDLARRIKGPEREKLSAVFHLAAEKKVKRYLRSPFLIRRLMAARLLDFFTELPDPELLRKLLKDKAPVRLAAISALARVPTEKTVSFILETLETDPAPDFQTYLEILFPLGEALENPLRQSLKKTLRPEILSFYIELAGVIPLRRLYPDLLVFKNSENKEVRIKTARAISRMELPESFTVLLEMASDSSWEVQAQAILGLGRLKNPEAIPFLVAALSSPYWHVRLNAKEALLLMGEPGIEALRQVASSSSDRFAADMARMGLLEYEEFYQRV